MKVPKAIQKACQVLRRRVRFTDARLCLPETKFPEHDTEKIQEATQIYVETWIIPLLNKIELGELKMVESLCRMERGDPIEQK